MSSFELGRHHFQIGLSDKNTVCLPLDIYVVSMSWLLKIVLQWALGYMCPFELQFSQGEDMVHMSNGILISHRKE